MSVSAFPLSWPPQRPRRAATARKFGHFSVKKWNGHYNATATISIAEAVKRIQDELDAIGARYPVISSNLDLRLDGLPRSGQAEAVDPGVALYFDLKGKPHCLPCDTYTKVAQNMAAIAAHMEKTRAIERYGVASIAEMFAGFEALPAPGKADSQQWRNVLGLGRDETITEDALSDIYRQKAREAGNEAALKELNIARDEARKFLRGGA